MWWYTEIIYSFKSKNKNSLESQRSKNQSNHNNHVTAFARLLPSLLNNCSLWLTGNVFRKDENFGLEKLGFFRTMVTILIRKIRSVWIV